MFGDCDHAGTGVDCGGDGKAGVGAGLLLWSVDTDWIIAVFKCI